MGVARALRQRVTIGFQSRLGAGDSQIEAALDPLDLVSPADVATQLVDRKILEPAAQRIEANLEDDPLIAARLQIELSRAYRRLGVFDKAEQYADAARDLREQELGPAAPATLSARDELLRVYLG